MPSNRTTHAAILASDQVGDLLLKQLIETSAAGRVLGVIRLESATYRLPIVSSDPSASWVDEGQEIPVSDSDVDEIEVSPFKLAGLTVISSELAHDSSPAAQQVVGDGLVRDISRKLDAALFAEETANGPAGLPSLTGVVAHTAASDAAVIDAFIGASYGAEANNGRVGSWVCHPDTAAHIAGLKKATGSNEPLLGADVTLPGARQLLGAPLITAASAEPGEVWGIDPSFSQLVIREDATVEADTSAFFSSDRVAVRAKIRAGFAFAHPGSVAKVTITL